ncbi:hypothetical protein L195_g021627 [Trifolium pratense]|uniref:Uncharacterized protein n=1 Tax=Trifolium pratense TaxID=57577 RepID=A0A2K3N5S2_TRIPR|nr:hypothetical protein L195_g021627 [Trifolium pratense]
MTKTLSAAEVAAANQQRNSRSSIDSPAIDTTTTTRTSIHSSTTDATISSEQIIVVAAALRREQQRAFQAKCMKYGLDVSTLGVSSTHRIIQFLEKSEDRRITNPYMKIDKDYKDLGYVYLDELLGLLDNYCLYEIDSAKPKLLKNLIPKLHCHALGRDWIDSLESALATDNMAEIEKLTKELSVVEGNFLFYDKTSERMKNIATGLNTNLEESIKKEEAHATNVAEAQSLLVAAHVYAVENTKEDV